MARKSLSIDEIMNMNRVQSRHSLPQGFPPPPPDVGDFKGTNETQYKEYMKKKLLREEWENALLLYRLREREHDVDGMRKAVDKANNQAKMAGMRTGGEVALTGRAATAVDEMMDSLTIDDGLQLQEQEQRNLEHLQPRLTVNTAPVVHKSNGSPTPLPQAQPYVPPNRPIYLTDDTPPKRRSDDEIQWQEKSTSCKGCKKMCARVCAPKLRRWFFIPAQVLAVILVIPAIALSSLFAAIVCGVAIVALAVFAAILIFTNRQGKSLIGVAGFFVGEALMLLLALIGAFLLNGVYFVSLGIPAMICGAIATGLGFYFVLWKVTVKIESA